MHEIEYKLGWTATLVIYNFSSNTQGIAWEVINYKKRIENEISWKQ